MAARESSTDISRSRTVRCTSMKNWCLTTRSVKCAAERTAKTDFCSVTAAISGYSVSLLLFSVANHLEKLEKSGNCKVIREKLGKMKIVRENIFLPTVYYCVKW